ncbi:dihydroorotate dehydrogenase [Alkaliphilus peptidifermentans]|uniref:Dihydroorotate dehydrogenase n=1 Tax=Alkaliphilus peptidifermentans DSM 18978 TaxID=1120976 RepID=A0A1G5GI47_9FIRM|nr:dihydroorotate dehydrogenase [Alkaliphilus peptidifermentans]SCY51051.1 dihydroorotate dehydrogenase (NAD+) catalytic subunit [Alkaliphilus peptidifermentans DSM 18978]
MNRPDLKVNIAGVELKNPVMTASGTFGSGLEYGEYIDLNQLGAVVTKGVASVPWKGNSGVRVAETYGGMLNSVGLQNPGIEEFIKKDIPFLRKYDTKIVVNIAGKTLEEYCSVVERLYDEDVDLLELNISCPNVKEGGVCFGTDTEMVSYVVKEVKKRAKQPLIVKLTPNVTDIAAIAKAAEAAGADAISLINTLLGMAIDIYRRKPVLGNIVGGLSGPAIKPVALRMVYQVANAVKVPIIGMGGIISGEDAVEFLLAGATGIAVGTANFVNPRATMDVLEGVEEYLVKYNEDKVIDIIGTLNI